MTLLFISRLCGNGVKRFHHAAVTIVKYGRSLEKLLLTGSLMMNVVTVSALKFGRSMYVALDFSSHTRGPLYHVESTLCLKMCSLSFNY